jgi:hypothetical protein
MASQSHSHELHVGKFEASQALKTISFTCIGIGVLTFIVGLMKFPEQLWTSYLTSYFFYASLGLGGMFFLGINYVTKAGWMVSIRRYVEAMTSFIPVILVGGLVLLLGLKKLYLWGDQATFNETELFHTKAAYLNPTFFAIRMVVFCSAMLVFRKLLVGNSLKQDVDGKEIYTHQSVGTSIAFLLVFSLGFSLFSVDLLMSLLPQWYSTIYGIYMFSGMFQATMAALMLLMIYVRRQGFVKGYVSDEHIHDVAKYMKAFTIFWAYIAFSQYMLIWYANIPEETEFYLMRMSPGWLGISLFLLVFKFIVPFLALLPRWAKRSESNLILVSILILITQYVDIYWQIYPNFFDNHVTFGFMEVGLFLGFGGLFLLGVISFLSKNSLVPLKDPRLHEAVHHHVTY